MAQSLSVNTDAHFLAKQVERYVPSCREDDLPAVQRGPFPALLRRTQASPPYFQKVEQGTQLVGDLQGRLARAQHVAAPALKRKMRSDHPDNQMPIGARRGLCCLPVQQKHRELLVV